MKFKTSEVYNAAVITFKGKLRGGPDAHVFQDQIKNYLDQGKKNIIVNMSDVSFVDSSGIGNIVSAFSTVKDSGGQLKLAGLNDKIKGVLSITRLEKIFEQFPTVEEASKSFK
ncbi:MAG: STAS domain-containing protein [Ignavibacteriae bacterium]|nr:STAS domain-containing protein [Ignavibacteriota bacterium]MCB0752990.1 STAS domain-containing protein [Ignavibacteriota bacterium]MCB9211279.1 STAS domain-containing protein [Ignavibacteriales bacterium]